MNLSTLFVILLQWIAVILFTNGFFDLKTPEETAENGKKDFIIKIL